MVDYRSSFIIVLWISILSFSLHEAWCGLKEAFPSHRTGASSLNFMVVGDWGGQGDPPYYTDPEKDVAEQMGEITASMGAQFTLSMGDNFYDNGVTDVDDPRLKETFEVKYIKKLATTAIALCSYLYEALHCTTLRCFMTR